MDYMAARVAMNQARFREANEHIEGKALVAGVELMFLICECADPDCTELIRVTRGEYEAIRADPVRFLYAKGHEVNSAGYGQVVSSNDRFVVVDKVGDAARIVEHLDQRRRDEQDVAWTSMSAPGGSG